MDTAKAEAALHQLEPLIQTRVRRRLRGWPAERLDDVLQDVRLKLWQVLISDKDIENVPAYAQRLLDNSITDTLRATIKRRGQFVVLDHEFVAPDDPAGEVAAADFKLTPNQRELLCLYQQHGSAAAIADHLGIERQQVSVRLSKLRRAMKEKRAA